MIRALAFFVDPATGAPRLACGCRDRKVCVFDPVVGGEALVVINVGWEVNALAFFTDPTWRRCSLCGCREKRSVSSTRSLVVKRWS